MKKIFFSLMAVGLLFSACSSDEGLGKSESKGEGNLKGVISFEGVNNSRHVLKAAATDAVPVTSWDNINQVQMFLYDADGQIAFSYTVKPTATVTQFQWTSIPEGTYTLALVANVKSNTDNVTTTVAGRTGAAALWDDYNVRGLKINDQVYIDLKPTALPTGHTFAPASIGYKESSEIFTAYAANVKIEEGETTDLTSVPLKLLREVSLMRTRFNTTKIPVRNAVKFDTEASYVVIQRLPVGFGLKSGTFAGGVYDTPVSDTKRIMVAGSGATAFLTANPSYGAIVGKADGFTMWRDIKILPNAAASENKLPAENAAPNRKYYLMIAGRVDAGYVYADGTKATATQPVYWFANVGGVFTKNTIREVNITIESAGLPEVPVEPGKEGGLLIEISAPEDWNSKIESEDIIV